MEAVSLTPQETLEKLVAGKKVAATAGLKVKGGKTPRRHSKRLASSGKESPKQELSVHTTKTSGRKNRINGTQGDPQEDACSQKEKQDGDGDNTTGGSEDADPSSPPEFVDRIVSYSKDPHTSRPGHGLVGKYIPGNGYNVQFKFIDDLEPKESEQHCTQDWIEDHLVDADTALAWTTAVSEQNKKEAPLSQKRNRGQHFFIPLSSAFLRFISIVRRTNRFFLTA